MVNALVIKAHLKGLDDTTKLTEDEEEFLYEKCLEGQIF